MSNSPTASERIRHLLHLARQADANGTPHLARSFRRMARDRGPAPAVRQTSVLGD